MKTDVPNTSINRAFIVEIRKCRHSSVVSLSSFSFGDRDLSHDQYTRGDGTSPGKSKQFDSMEQAAGTT